MKRAFSKCLAILLAVVLMAGTMTASFSAFADTQSSQSSSSEQSKITATTTLNADGSITISGTADLWGWIERVAVYKGNQMSDPLATYSAGGYIASQSASNTMSLAYSIDLKGSKVTTEGYTVIVSNPEKNAWAAAYVASPAGTVEGVGGSEEESGSGSGSGSSNENVIGDGTVDVTAVKNADGSVTFSGTVSAPLSLQYVSYKIGNHLDMAELVYTGGTKMASYAPNDVAAGADQISGTSYTFNKTFTGRYVSEVGYTIVFQDLWGTNFTAAFIPTEGGTGVDLVKYYGEGVSDEALKRWATIYKNNKQQQVLAVNEVKQMIQNIGTPARTKNADKDELIAWYTEVKPVQEYEYDELYLNDYYVQGVWDTMPAAYGWMQDQYTEPGKWVAAEYGLSGLAYGIAGGGQNPWVLMDYIERNIGVAGANTDGWAYGYDEVAEAPYLWHEETGMLLTYENARSLQAKIDYINEEDLGGIIIWEMSGDNTDTYPMTTQLYEGLNEGKMIVGYFTNWAVYNEYHQKQDPLDLPFDMMTHINYSFMQIENNKIETMDAWADTTGEMDYGAPQMFNKVKQMKELYPDTKVLLSVGGWTRGDTFYNMVSNPANRATFIASCVQYLKDYPMFDGIDFDWEYPGITARAADHDDPNDRGCPTGADTDFENFSALVYEMRQALDGDAELVARGSNIMSACLPAAPAKQDAQPCVAIAEYCDYVNVMTYDFHGAFDPVGPVYDAEGNETGEYWSIGYNAPLYAHEDTPDEWCTVNAVENLLAKGISRDKINIGTPYYSRGWAGIPADENGIPLGIVDPTPLAASDLVIPEEPEEPTPDPEPEPEPDPEPTEADVFVFKINDNNVLYANQNVKFPVDAPAQLVGGKTLVPLRAIGSAVGIDDLAYSGNKITFTGFDGYAIEMTIGSTVCTLTKGGTSMNVTIAAPVLINGITMLPLRDATNLVGGTVKFEDLGTTDRGYVIVSAGTFDDADVAGYIEAYEAA